jgi:2-polyprenyl-3-methyl-5-hydroxy-6-metoxy-1,4-benzoquinol methylase
MNILPWRVRAFISQEFPLLYHLAVNVGKKRRSESYWDERLADTWHQRTWPTKNQLIADMTLPDQVILDIACGNGSILRDLKSRGYQNLHGLEISNYAVNRLRSEGFIMHHASIPTLQLPNDMFDVVIASQVLEHIIRRHKFAEEIARVLKPGGQAFIFVPNNCLGPIDEPEHVIAYKPDSLRKFLDSHFEVISLEVIKDANYPMTILFGHVQRRHIR